MAHIHRIHMTIAVYCRSTESNKGLLGRISCTSIFIRNVSSMLDNGIQTPSTCWHTQTNDRWDYMYLTITINFISCVVVQSSMYHPLFQVNIMLRYKSIYLPNTDLNFAIPPQNGKIHTDLHTKQIYFDTNLFILGLWGFKNSI